MEFLDVVDREDKVVSRASYEEVYQNKLGHRIVHVMIFNSEGKIALQLRSSQVGFCPGHWSTTVGGHVRSGEEYNQAALREYQEELGVQSDLDFLGKDFYQIPGRPNKFLVTFKTRFDGPFRPNPKEVEKVSFFTIDEIKKMVENGEKIHPELLFLLKRYFF